MTTPNIPTYAAWRSMTQHDKRLFMQQVRLDLSSRWDMGEEKYDSAVTGFQGHPLQHAYEEWQDLGVYLYYIRRYVKALEHRATIAWRLLGDNPLSEIDWGRDN